MFHRINLAVWSCPLHEQPHQELPERQRAATEHRERGASKPAVARLWLFPADLDGDQPRRRDGGRLGTFGEEDQELLSKWRIEDTSGEDSVSAEAGQDYENPRAMQNALSC